MEGNTMENEEKCENGWEIYGKMRKNDGTLGTCGEISWKMTHNCGTKW